MRVDGVADRVHRKVDLAVQILDDFTDLPIQKGKVQVRIVSEDKPLIKSDGYYIFMNLKKTKLEVCITSAFYYPRMLALDLKQYSDNPPLVKVRMVPNRTYPVPYGTTCMQGTAESGSLIRIICQDKAKTVKLLYEYERPKQGEYSKIHIYNPENMELEGRWFFITNKEKKAGEYFSISGTKAEEPGTYLLAQPLKENYKKIGTSIYPVYTGQADEKGKFFFLLEENSLKTCQYICEALGSKVIRKEYEVLSGKMNEINLL
ncbi:hypothetical protein LQZ18_03895 [Lachnospiraceae bacterium ZAX-1]